MSWLFNFMFSHPRICACFKTVFCRKFNTYEIAHRYELVPLDGFSVYVLKRSAAEGETAHWLCPSCAKNGKYGYMQKIGDDESNGGVSTAIVACSRCKNQYSMCIIDFMRLWGRYAEELVIHSNVP